MTILNVMNCTGLVWLLIVGLGILVAGIILIAITIGTLEGVYIKIGTILALGGAIIIMVSCWIPNGEVKYEVTLDENIKMVEFYEQYEVVEQRGDIWVIKEKK